MKNKILVLISCFGISGIIWLATTLSEQHEIEFESIPVLAQLPEGLAPTSSFPEEVKIKIKSTGWKLLGFLGKGSPDLMLRIKKDDINQRIDLRRSVRENAWFSADMNLISVYPEEINVILDKKISRRVPVGFRGELSFSQGFGLAKAVRIIPDSVTISGSFRVIQRIDSIYTELITLHDLNSFTEATAGFGKKYSEIYPSEVKLQFDVQQIVEKEFRFNSITVKDIPPDRSVLLLPEGINLILRGGITELAKLDTSLIKVYLNYSDIVNSGGETIVPRIEVPPHYELVTVIPEKIKFILKKF